jgi:hypothetical protein
MWPQRGEALSRTIEAEGVLEDLYAEALNQWVVTLEPFVLPSLTAATLPPDPDAVAQNTGVLDKLLDELILAALSILYALSAVESSEGMEIELPDLDYDIPVKVVNPVVLRTITRITTYTEADITYAHTMIEQNSDMRQGRDDFIETQRELVGATPAMMRDRTTAAVADAAIQARRDPTPPTPEVVVTRQREAAASVLTPGSEAVRDISRLQSYQAAGVQNAAVLAAAAQSPEVLDKTWIATIDGKTRHSHFAADGQRAPLSGTFTVGGAALRYPGDPAGPVEEVRNCRCRVGVLAPDEELPTEVDRHTERLNGRDSTARNRQGSQADEIDRRERAGTIRARDDDDGIGRTASAAPSEEITTMATDTDTATRQFVTFTDQPVAFVGIESSDGRMLAKDIELTVRQLPIPAMWCEKQEGGHYGNYVVGATEAARIDGDRIVASGYMLDDEHGEKAFDLAARKISRPSVDLAATEWILTVDGKEISEEEWWDLPADAHVVQTITKAELIGFTLVATPAFGETYLEFNEETEPREIGLVASAAEDFRPRTYAADMLRRNPNQFLTEPTELQMDPETGRIFGHLACFGQCHRSIQAQCVMAPRSKTDYSHFHTSPAVNLDDGTRIAVGRLTVGTGHASDKLGPGPAMAHYDNTGACWALVRAYETPIGIEVSGVAAPWATAEQIEMGLSAPLSGDWRDFGNGLELIAALSVNTPGSPYGAVTGPTADRRRWWPASARHRRARRARPPTP